MNLVTTYLIVLGFLVVVLLIFLYLIWLTRRFVESMIKTNPTEYPTFDTTTESEGPKDTSIKETIPEASKVNLDKTVIVAAIAAHDSNLCIGKDNKLPWHSPSDLKRFKLLTTDSVVVMGRKTFESIVSILGKPLPNRTSIVISKSENNETLSKYENDIEILGSIDGAINRAKYIAGMSGRGCVYVIGGDSIYKYCAENDLIDLYCLSVMHENCEDGDAFFPEIDYEAAGFVKVVKEVCEDHTYHLIFKHNKGKGDYVPNPKWPRRVLRRSPE